MNNSSNVFPINIYPNWICFKKGNDRLSTIQVLKGYFSIHKKKKKTWTFYVVKKHEMWAYGVKAYIFFIDLWHELSFITSKAIQFLTPTPTQPPPPKKKKNQPLQVIGSNEIGPSGLGAVSRN